MSKTILCSVKNLKLNVYKKTNLPVIYSCVKILPSSKQSLLLKIENVIQNNKTPLHMCVQANTSPSSARKVDNSSDMVRLKEIFFQLRDVREDSQQRGWAVHDDLGLIMEYLSELLQILVRGEGEGGRGRFALCSGTI